MQLEASSWVFARTLIVKADDKLFPLRDVEMSRDNGSGTIWETADIALDDKTLEIARAIAASKKTVIRFEGSDSHADRELSKAMISEIRDVLDAYEKLSAPLLSAER